MKNLFTTIAALVLAVASYGQIGFRTTTTLGEYFSGNWGGNYYFGGFGASYVPDAYSNMLYENGTTTGISDRFAYYMTGSTGFGTFNVFSTFTDKWTLSVNTPAPSTYGLGTGNIIVGSLASYDNRYNIPYWLVEGPWTAPAQKVTPANSTFSIKVTNNSTMSGFIRFEAYNNGRYNSLIQQTLEFAIPANKTSYLISSAFTLDFSGMLIRTSGVVGDIEIDDFRLGFALPTGITPLIEANNSTTVDRFGTLTFAIPSVTGSVEYANEIPLLSVSPSTLGTIDQTGVFTAGATGGVVTITAASYGVSSSYVVTISSVIYATNATVSGVSAFTVGGVTNYSISNITPSNAQVPTSTVWVSSNPAVATINGTSGALKAVGAGTTNIYSLLVLSNGTTITSNLIFLTINAIFQSISYTSVPSKTTIDVPFNLQATASSGLPVSFQVLSGPASVSGNQVTLNGTAGMVMIRASQAGNSSFLAAPSIDFSFVVSSPVLQNQTISFPDVVAKVSTDLPFNLIATASSGLPISYTLVQGLATLSGNQVTLNGSAGIIIIRASQTGNGTYNPATSVEKFILVNNASLTNQSITFPSISDKQNNSSFNLSATASSGLTVSYEIVSGPANISGNTVNLTSGYGNVTIRASQSGNSTYNPAQYVERTFNVCESIGTSNVTISNSGNSTFCLPSAITLTSSINYPVMLWSNGSTNPSIAVQSSGLYTLTVGSGLCKVVSNSAQITVKTPIITPICMVTVDEISGKNKVIFEKPSGYLTSIANWKIYRESTVSNQYLLQSSLSLANLSEYIDLTSFPTTQAYRYKLETVDNNCNITNQSAAHKTMHLTINKGQNASTWNLIWTPYEGMPLATHRIYRGTSATNLTYLVDLAGSLTSYTDATAPAVNNIYYVVELITGQSCNPTARTEAYTAIRSNMAETASTSTENVGFINSNVTIYPNPTTGSFTISCENGSVYIITDLLGRKLAEGLLTNGKAEVSDLNLTSGIYLVGVGQYKSKLVVR